MRIATERCMIPNLFHFRHSCYPSVFLVCGGVLLQRPVTDLTQRCDNTS